MDAFLKKTAQYWKAVVAVLGLVGQLIAANLITGSALHWAQVVIAFATVVGVWLAKNDPYVPGPTP